MVTDGPLWQNGGMKTFLVLKNEQPYPLPAPLQRDDIRFPEALVEHFLTAYTAPGALILDPFAGYGTTLRVAERLGRVAYGLEFDARRYTYARQHLRHPGRLLHGDALRLGQYGLPPIDFSLTSPPYMRRDDTENPFTSYHTTGQSYAVYLRDIRSVYEQLARLLRPGARVVIEVANLKDARGVTTLAWDIGTAVSTVLHFGWEIVVGWDTYGYGYDHSYCLAFSKPPVIGPATR